MDHGRHFAKTRTLVLSIQICTVRKSFAINTTKIWVKPFYILHRLNNTNYNCIISSILFVFALLFCSSIPNFFGLQKSHIRLTFKKALLKHSVEFSVSKNPIEVKA